MAASKQLTPPPNWDAQLVNALGAPGTPANLAFFNDLAAEERGLVDPATWGQPNHGGSNNPIDTVLGGVPGATSYNSVGVQNYPDWPSGLAATVSVLNEHWYAAFLAKLRGGKSSLADLQNEYDKTPADGTGITFANPGGMNYGIVAGLDSATASAVKAAHDAPSTVLEAVPSVPGDSSQVSGVTLSGIKFDPITGLLPNIPGASGAAHAVGKAVGGAIGTVGGAAGVATVDALKSLFTSSLAVRGLILIVSIVLLLMGLKELTEDTHGPGQTIIAPIAYGGAKVGSAAKGAAKSGGEAAAVAAS